MPRAVDGSKRKNRRKKIVKHNKGYYGKRKSNFRTAKDAMKKALSYAYRDRRAKKRDFRRLWITRISAAVKELGLNYSTFINGLNKAGITINRKALSNMAIEDPKSFSFIVEEVKKSL